MQNHTHKDPTKFLEMRAQNWEITPEDAKLQLERAIIRRRKIGEKIVELLEYLDILPQILTREYVAVDQLFAESLERDAALIYLEPKREQLAKLREKWHELSAEIQKLEFAFAFEKFDAPQFGSIFAPLKPATAPRRRAFD